MNAATNNQPHGAGLSGVAPTDGQAAKAWHILVADDDRVLRNLMMHFLRRAGFQVTCAEDGEAAWEALCHGDFDAVITDNDMPRLTGLGLLRRIRTISSRIPVIMISGMMPEGEADLPQLLSPGLALHKPFSLVHFITTVQRVLTSGRGGDEALSHALPPDFGRAGDSEATHPHHALVA